MLIVQLLIRDKSADTVRRIARIHGQSPEDTVAGLLLAAIHSIETREALEAVKKEKNHEN